MRQWQASLTIFKPRLYISNYNRVMSLATESKTERILLCIICKEAKALMSTLSIDPAKGSSILSDAASHLANEYHNMSKLWIWL